MSATGLRGAVARWMDGRLERGSRELPDALLERSAVVVSPHFDDETLGCGGTILRKRAAGAEVGLAFMTDGRTSHAHLMEPSALARMRADEGRAAGRALGLPDDAVFLLGLPEGQLADHEAAATERLADLLAQRRPEQVFLPARSEPLIWSEDHLATARAAWEAARRAAPEASLYEYPVWIWFHWPWVPARGAHWGETAAIARHTWRYARGGLAREFPDVVRIESVLAAKRAALAAHHSQVDRVGGDPGWPTLADVGGGGFLERFFQPTERFRVSRPH